MHRHTVAFPLFTMLALAGCVPPAKQRVVAFCNLPGVECPPAAEQSPEIQAQLVEQAWCCPDGDPCFPVNGLTDCAITDVAIYCEYGRSTPASYEGGTSGFECYG